MSKKQKYFLTQKLLGVLMLIVSVISMIILDGDITVALFTVPIGLTLLFSKEMIFTNEYFFEVKEANGEL